MSLDLARSIARMHVALERVDTVLRRDYPVGADITWRPHRSAAPRAGRVVAHATGGKIFVRDGRNGRTLYVTAGEIAAAVEAGVEG